MKRVKNPIRYSGNTYTRIIRGSCRGDSKNISRSAKRSKTKLEYQFDSIGFRLVAKQKNE